MASVAAPPLLINTSRDFPLGSLPTLETPLNRFAKQNENGGHSPVPQRFYSWGRNTFSCFRVDMMKAYEITARLRQGSPCFMSSCPRTAHQGISGAFLRAAAVERDLDQWVCRDGACQLTRAVRGTWPVSGRAPGVFQGPLNFVLV